MDNNYTNSSDLMESWGYTSAAIVLSVNGLLGFVLNLLVILLMAKDMQLWNPMNIILFNLVCSDFSVSLFGNPFALTAALYHRWIFGKALCVCYGFFMALLGITSIATLTVLSYERLCLIKFPFSTRQLNNRGAFISIILIWCYSLAVTTPPLFGWGAYVNEAANISCSVNWETRTTNATSYILYIFFFGSIVPCTIITYSYINIIVVIRSSAMRVGRRNRSEVKVTFMVAVMILAFMVAWTPYSVFALIKQFGDADSIGPGMGVLPSLFAKTSICYNPIIYVAMNSQFQQAFNRLRNKHESTAQNTTVNTTFSESECSVKTKKERKKLKLQQLREYTTMVQMNSESGDNEKHEIELTHLDGSKILSAKNTKIKSTYC